MDPIWEDVRAVEIVPMVCGLNPKRNKELDEEWTLRLMQGCLSSLGALHGWLILRMPGRAHGPWWQLNFEEQGRTFGRMVRQKADRRLPVTP